ncbi:hypothetical protein D7X33_32730 [Butyricicoccus sp. 1XD8-22]|nr:hypothetical protein D7X33_32730 [Butyricicoccus sp. 1XD8-22]
MNILATVEYHFWFWVIVIFLFIVTLILLSVFIGGIISVIQSGFENTDLIVLLFLMGLFLLFGYATYSAYNEGVYVEYKATITDFNEVFNNGYEIVGNEGEIYTLKKVK